MSSCTTGNNPKSDYTKRRQTSSMKRDISHKLEQTIMDVAVIPACTIYTYFDTLTSLSPFCFPLSTLKVIEIVLFDRIIDILYHLSYIYHVHHFIHISTKLSLIYFVSLEALGSPLQCKIMFCGFVQCLAAQHEFPNTSYGAKLSYWQCITKCQWRSSVDHQTKWKKKKTAMSGKTKRLEEMMRERGLAHC